MFMATILLEIEDKIKENLGIWDRVSYDFLIEKFWDNEDLVLPDLTFTPYRKLTDKEKKELDNAKKYKGKLINI